MKRIFVLLETVVLADPVTADIDKHKKCQIRPIRCTSHLLDYSSNREINEHTWSTTQALHWTISRFHFIIKLPPFSCVHYFCGFVVLFSLRSITFESITIFYLPYITIGSLVINQYISRCLQLKVFCGENKLFLLVNEDNETTIWTRWTGGEARCAVGYTPFLARFYQRVHLHAFHLSI